MNARLDRRALALIAVTLLFWSSAFAGIRAGLAAYRPAHVALLRFLVASAVLAIYAMVTRMRMPARQDIPAILGLGFIGITVYHTSLTFGEVTVTAGAASLIIAAAPIFGALLAAITLGERLRPLGWLGIAVSFAGVALITIGEGEGLGFDPGAALVMLSALATSVFFVLQKPFLQRYTALEFTSYTIWAGTLFMLIFLPGLPAEIRTAPLGATLSIVYLGIFPAALAYVTWAAALALAPASQVMSFLYVNPVLAIFIAWLWLGEIPSPLSLIGGATALAGVILVNTRGKETAPQATTR